MRTTWNTDHNRARRTRAQLNAEIEQLLIEVRGLALVKGLLKRRGVTRAELEAHAAEVDRARDRLADLVGTRSPEPANVLGEAA
jgi:hypothetical protein